MPMNNNNNTHTHRVRCEHDSSECLQERRVEAGRGQADIAPTEVGNDLRSTKHRHSDEACLLVGCLSSQQHASVSQGRICSHNFTCCHTEIEAADQTFYLTQSQYTDTGPTSPSADPITPGAWQDSH